VIGDPEAGTPLTPYCIIGHALHENGVSLNVLQAAHQMKFIDIAQHPGESVYAPIDNLIAATPPQDIYWLAYVQHQQDHGFTWAEAVQAADNQYPDMKRENA